MLIVFTRLMSARLVIGKPVFSPATPAGIVELLSRRKIPTQGKHVVIIGRSNIVGKPLANLMVQKKIKMRIPSSPCYTPLPET